MVTFSNDLRFFLNSSLIFYYQYHSVKCAWKKHIEIIAHCVTWVHCKAHWFIVHLLITFYSPTVKTLLYAKQCLSYSITK